MVNTLRNLMILNTLVLLTAGAVHVANLALQRVEHARALQCAQNSDGTDSAICECYAKFDLPIPEDM